MKPKLLIDFDPGYDDAIAILCAARDFDVLGITVNFGYQTVELTARNALRVLALAAAVQGPIDELVDTMLAPDPPG